MIHVEASRTIERPIHEVWAYISDLDNMPAWDPGLVSVKWQPPLRSGTQYEARDSSPLLRVASRIVPPVLTVTDFEEGRRFAVGISRGASSFKAIYTLESVTPASTRITRSFTFDGHGIWRVLEVLSRRRAIHHREAEIESIKRILEAQA